MTRPLPRPAGIMQPSPGLITTYTYFLVRKFQALGAQHTPAFEAVKRDTHIQMGDITRYHSPCGGYSE